MTTRNLRNELSTSHLDTIVSQDCAAAHAYAIRHGAVAGSPNYRVRWDRFWNTHRAPVGLADRQWGEGELLAYSDRCFDLASRHFTNMRRAGFPDHRWKRWHTLTDAVLRRVLRGDRPIPERR
jgi:hypothetical protein